MNSWPHTVYANSFWADTIRREEGKAWATSDGTPILRELGLVDPARVEAILTGKNGPASPSDLVAAWRALSLDSWLRGIEDRGHDL